MANAGDGIGVTSRVSKVTLSKWIKKVSDQAERKMALVPILRKKGRINTLDGGGDLRWPVRYKYHDLLGHVDGLDRQVSRLNDLVNATLPWAGYEVVDAITPVEKAQNKGESAIVRIFDQKISQMQMSAAQRMAGQLYNDASVAQANIPLPLHGIESMMSIGSQTATAEFQSSSDDTYAGISTSRTVWTSDTTAPGYEGWTPVVVNGNRTVSGSAVDWADAADEYLRAGLLKAHVTNDPDDMCDVVLLTQTRFKDLLNLLDDKERKTVAPDYAESAYGFRPGSTVQYEGAMVNWDAACPASDADSYEVFGYGFNTSKMELCMLDVPGFSRGKDSLFGFAEFLDPGTAASWLRLLFYGQLRFESPRYFVKFSKMGA